MRLVGRSRLRSRLLPQPPLAEMCLDTARHDRLSRLLRCTRRHIPRSHQLGTARCARSARRAPAAWSFPGEGGWQVPGRVHHRRGRQGPRTPHSARAARGPGRSARRCAPGLDAGVSRMTDTRIAFVHGRRVWDSRGRPTVEAEVLLEGGGVGRAIAPAGASTGTGEALDLRDGGDAFGGYDVTRAIGHVNGEIARAVAGIDGADQPAVDRRLIELDGTPSKSRLGGNATLAV